MLTNQLSARGRRALGLGVLALVVIAVAGFAYLRSSATLSTKPTIEVPFAKTVLATPNQFSYEFVTPSIGWAVENLDTPTTPAGGFAVFKTTDGAKHWQKQLQLESSFVGFVPLSVQFIDQAHGFVAVGDPFEQLNRTTDGGTTWNSIPLPAGSQRLDGVGFSSSRYGWLLVGGLTSTLYATNDAGTDWQRLSDPPSDATALRYRSPTEAWLGSTGPNPTPPHVYMSGDAGNTWTRVDLPPPPGTSWTGDHYIPAGVELLPNNGVVAFIPPVDQPELAPFSRVLTSFDRGKTWHYLPAPPGVVAYQDATHWWSIKGTALFKSSDAGESWVMVTSALPDLQYIPHILDSKHAWALTAVVGGYGLAMTSDGGLHWSQANVPQP